jgi:hypothetical protein
MTIGRPKLNPVRPKWVGLSDAQMEVLTRVAGSLPVEKRECLLQRVMGFLRFQGNSRLSDQPLNCQLQSFAQLHQRGLDGDVTIHLII